MIHIGSYGLKADSDCWQFGKIGTKKDPKSGKVVEYIQNPRFPTSLEQALSAYVERAVLDTDPSDWSEVRVALEEISGTLKDIRRILRDTRGG